MGDKTGIEWTDATWNPLTGCTKVSAGCDHCYAETIAHRFAGTKAYPNGFQVTLRPERLNQPLCWQRPRRIFVNSMADLFHDDVPDEYVAEVWAVMARAGQHTFQLLTKRHARMRSLLSSEMFRRQMYDSLVALDYSWISANPLAWPLPNVWLGVSVENQQWADIRIPALLQTPAAVRWISAEPLLGPIDFVVPNGRRLDGGPRRDSCLVEVCMVCGGWGGDICPDGPHFVKQLGGLDWVVVGGESGRRARPMHPEWARMIRDQCVQAGVAFHFKQWGEFNAAGERVGKKAAGRELDGRTWDGCPETAQPVASPVSS